MAQDETKTLWAGHELAARALFDTKSAGLASGHVAELAVRLASDGAAEAGLDVLAASMAVAETQEAALAALLGDLVRRKDLESATAVSRLLRTASDRLARLAEAHSGLVARRTRPAVVASVASVTPLPGPRRLAG